MKGLYLIILGLFSGVYWIIFKNTFIWLVNSWLYNKFYTHGFVIFALCLVLIIINGLRIKEISFNPKNGLQLWIPSVILIIIGFILHFRYMFAVSFILAAAALNKSLIKKECTKHLNRPLWLMLLVFPLPFLYEISGYLSYASSKLAAFLLSIFFPSVIVNGVEIMIPPGISFTIGINCSGANSILALVTLVFLWFVFIKNNNKVTTGMLLLTLPAGFLTNIFRIFTIFIIAWARGMDRALIFWHDFAGYFFYIISLTIMFLAWILLTGLTKDDTGFRKLVIPKL